MELNSLKVMYEDEIMLKNQFEVQKQASEDKVKEINDM